MNRAHHQPRQLDNPTGEPSLVRPYARANRRPRAPKLSIDAFVTATEYGRGVDRFANRVHRAICQLCCQPRSIAEVAARLGLPLGLARTLIADLAELHLVEVDDTGAEPNRQPSLELMERILDGLHRIDRD